MTKSNARRNTNDKLMSSFPKRYRHAMFDDGTNSEARVYSTCYGMHCLWSTCECPGIHEPRTLNNENESPNGKGEICWGDLVPIREQN